MPNGCSMVKSPEEKRRGIFYPTEEVDDHQGIIPGQWNGVATLSQDSGGLAMAKRGISLSFASR